MHYWEATIDNTEIKKCGSALVNIHEYFIFISYILCSVLDMTGTMAYTSNSLKTEGYLIPSFSQDSPVLPVRTQEVFACVEGMDSSDSFLSSNISSVTISKSP